MEVTAMDSKSFRKEGRKVLDYVADYLDTIGKRRVLPDVEPGCLRPLIPASAPEHGESLENITKEIEEKIMPATAHWCHPNFHAYFPNGNSYPSILADILSDAIGGIGFSWYSNPASTELEMIVLDWLVKAMGLPDFFLFTSGQGGGSMQGSASEAILTAMLTARKAGIDFLKKKLDKPEVEDSRLLPKLVAYTSAQAHSCVEKAALLSLLKLRILEPDDDNNLQLKQVQAAIEKDMKDGLHPCLVVCTLGTTGSTAVDNIDEIGEYVKKIPGCWLHVDGAYGGSGMILPEKRHLMKGIERVDSFNMNCNKWMLTAFDSSCVWFRNRKTITSAMTVNPLYLQYEDDDKTIDLRHWGIALSRRFRALKVWMVMRSFGIKGLQDYLRNHISLAKELEKMIKADPRFEVTSPVLFGVVCFRLLGKPGQSLKLQTINKVNQSLLASINHGGQIHMIPSSSKGKYFIRLCISYQHATRETIEFSWKVIQKHADKVIGSVDNETVKLEIPNARRYSYTRAVTREQYERMQKEPRLSDQASLIYFADDDIL